MNRELDKLGLLKGFQTFNFHPHLPHYALTIKDSKDIHVLSRQPIDLDRPHPFTEAGNTEINSLLWMPPKDERAAEFLGIDQPKISALIRGRLRSFSLERLIRFLNELGQDVSIMISPAKSQTERGSTWIGESYSNTRIAALGR